MRKQHFLSLSFVFCLFIICCTPSADDIFKGNQNSVVLLRHNFVYKVSFGEKSTAYFKTYSDDLSLTDLNFDKESALKDYNTSFGTGFFISSDGKIATNKHVAFPWQNSDTKKFKEKMVGNASVLQSKLEETRESVEDSMRLVKQAWDNYSRDWESQTKDRVEKYYGNLESKRERIKDVLMQIRQIQGADIQVSVETISLGYALNNTHVASDKDYVEVVPLKISDKDEIDIAILQTKDKKLPQNITSVIKIDESKLKEDLKVNDKVYMIGYNWGTEIAKSNQGIQVQMTQGTISQNPSEFRVLYSIPTLPGSSGSPILDQRGNLVAINYLGISGSQSFNYGILGKYLIEMLKYLPNSQTN